MKPYHQNEYFTLYSGDCLEVMAQLPDNSFDSIVTDAPYELGFMGKSWDSSGIAYDVDMWRQACRVLKPGGHLLAFSGSRTYHRMTVAIEDAGFDIRDQLMWIYGSGFPKSLNISKALDKAAGAERPVIGTATSWNRPDSEMGDRARMNTLPGEYALTAANTELAKKFEGWGTALKPAHEPIVLARKPLIGTVAANVAEHGTGGLNISGCRIGDDLMSVERSTGIVRNQNVSMQNPNYYRETVGTVEGRWPANVLTDGSAEVTGLMGEAASFFYSPKASKSDRNQGMTQFEPRRASAMGYELGLGEAGEGMFKDRNPQKQNFHPTVKPTELMQYLVRLITPPGGTLLDPFTGSGSTGKAAMHEGFNFVGIELTEEYLPIIVARVTQAQRPLF